MMKIILGLAGEMASGKGTVAKYATEKYSAKTRRFSTMLRDVLDRLSLEQSRDNMQKLSTVLRQSFGEDLFAQVMAEDVKKEAGEVIVIDGIRRLADIKFLKANPKFKLTYLEADMNIRYERIVKRGENADDAKKTFDDFKKANEDESELQIKDLKNRADFLIDNNGSYEELYKQVDEILKN
ncbi:MAG: AAA family ATPase [Candidatus Portnoybacteria bacterium]|nr:AAA family ATPase [Candidatus Portnoybacteria bacterium]MDD4982914.1 AAA family ATPase [Candidatus Portnoybacteria bacterium]